MRSAQPMRAQKQPQRPLDLRTAAAVNPDERIALNLLQLSGNCTTLVVQRKDTSRTVIEMFKTLGEHGGCPMPVAPFLRPKAELFYNGRQLLGCHTLLQCGLNDGDSLTAEVQCRFKDEKNPKRRWQMATGMSVWDTKALTGELPEPVSWAVAESQANWAVDDVLLDLSLSFAADESFGKKDQDLSELILPADTSTVENISLEGEEDESKEATNCQGAQCRALDFGKIPARYLILRLLSELSLSFFLLPSYIASDEGGEMRKLEFWWFSLDITQSGVEEGNDEDFDASPISGLAFRVT
ncbi:unnamed protein product, partial [Symbiodinium microadriaticum]